jgi:sugar phosphate isomerase/epimerase
MTHNLSRRSFLALTAAAPLVPAMAQNKKVPIGIEMYSVRNEMTKDLKGTVTAVAKMGYEVMEFYSPYFMWPVEQVKDLRKQLDDLGVKCLSTHNGMNAFTGDGIAKAIEYNKILGAKYIVLASAGGANTVDKWKGVAETLTKASEQFRAAGLRAGFHNHQTEWKAIEGQRPMDILAAGTPKDFSLQLDVGTAVEVGVDPVDWINRNPGRINSLHLKDWGKTEGYKVLFGEGEAPWKQIFAAAESKGGVEFYLIEQEGSRFPAIETAQKCLDNYKKMRA